MTCEICGAKVLPSKTKYIPAMDREDLEVKSEPMQESDYVCCGDCWKAWEAIGERID